MSADRPLEEYEALVLNADAYWSGDNNMDAICGRFLAAALTELVERVKRAEDVEVIPSDSCSGCPLHQYVGLHDGHACNATAPNEPGRRMTADEFYSDEPPSWCPLRTRPVLVRLSTPTTGGSDE